MITPFEIFWLFAIPAILFSWYHIVRHSIGFATSKRKALPHNPHPEIIFQIAARKLSADLNPIIKESIEAIKSSCAEVGYSNYRIKLLVDEIAASIEGVETMLVPKDFISKSKYKARALHYGLRFLPDSKDIWIMHLDEDSKVTPQCVSSVINYISAGGKPVANGPTVFPYDGNLLTFYAEAQRQWTFYWLQDQEISSNVHWLNGSNLLVRSDVEHAVGWDFENCFISEDSRFGYETYKKLGKVFGWHGGLTIEKPPASVGSLLKQRRRWFFGSLVNFKHVPKGRIPRRIYSIAVWFDGFILTIFFFLLILGFTYEPWFSGLFYLNAFSLTALLWVGRYEVGVYQNLRFSSLSRFKKILLHIGIIPLSPVVDLICNLPTVLAFIKRPKSFEITAKRSETVERTRTS